MKDGIHEMFDLVGPTETALRKECARVGQHLYVRSRVELDLGQVDSEALKDFPVVFAMGGDGSRLRHVTGATSSKHLIEVNRKRLCQYAFDMWRTQGVAGFRMLVDDSPGGREIKQFFGNGEPSGTRIEYFIERSRLGAGGALREAILAGLVDRSFILHYPDDQVVGYEDFPSDFARAAVAAMRAGYQVVVLCVPGTLYPWGEIPDERGEVVDFLEKPFITKDSYTGVCAVHQSAFDLIKALDAGQPVKLERTVFKELARRGKMFKVIMPTEYWFPVNDVPGLRLFEQATRP